MIVGLVLAGGRSSRMGRDKALLRIDGLTLLERTARVLRDAGAEHIAVSGARDDGIPDRWADAGPVGGIASAASRLPDGQWLVVPVDMPRLDAALLDALLVERSATAARWQHHPLPMRLTMDARTRAVLDDMMTRPGPACSVSALQAAVGVATLPAGEGEAARLINCNTPDEWREATA